MARFRSLVPLAHEANPGVHFLEEHHVANVRAEADELVLDLIRGNAGPVLHQIFEVKELTGDGRLATDFSYLWTLWKRRPDAVVLAWRHCDAKALDHAMFDWHVFDITHEVRKAAAANPDTRVCKLLRKLYRESVNHM